MSINYWPNTNIHELNLDWIIKKVRELDTRFTEDIEQFVKDYIDEHFAEWTVNANYDPTDETIIYTNGTGAELTAGDVIRFAIDNAYVNVKDPTARIAAAAAQTAADNASTAAQRANSKAETADSKAETADSKAVAAQSTANSATTAITSINEKNKIISQTVTANGITTTIYKVGEYITVSGSNGALTNAVDAYGEIIDISDYPLFNGIRFAMVGDFLDTFDHTTRLFTVENGTAIAVRSALAAGANLRYTITLPIKIS